jgi:hypothetical protein
MSRTNYKNAATSQSVGRNDRYDGFSCTHLVGEQGSLGISSPSDGAVPPNVDYIFD